MKASEMFLSKTGDLILPREWKDHPDNYALQVAMAPDVVGYARHLERQVRDLTGQIQTLRLISICLSTLSVVVMIMWGFEVAP